MQRLLRSAVRTNLNEAVKEEKKNVISMYRLWYFPQFQEASWGLQMHLLQIRDDYYMYSIHESPLNN